MSHAMMATQRSDKEQSLEDMRRYPLAYLRLVFAVRAWALWIPFVARNSDLSIILARTSARPGKPFEGLSPATIWRCCHKAVKRPWLMHDRPCLREGLLLNRFLAMAGHQPTLHFGVDKTSLDAPAIRAHCWVRLGDRIFNPPTSSMVEIHSHRSQASMQPAQSRKAV